MRKLKLLALAEKFSIEEVNKGDYRVRHKESDEMAFIEDGNIEYHLSVTPNDMSWHKHICIESLMELKEFCELMIEED